MSSTLSLDNFKEINVPSDNTCLYHSIIECLNNIPIKSRTTQIKAILKDCKNGKDLRAYLKIQYNKLSKLLKKKLCTSFYLTSEDYTIYDLENDISGIEACNIIVEKSFDKSSNIWAGDHEISLISYLLNINIIIYNQTTKIFQDKTLESSKSDVNVYVTYKNNNHYDSLIPSKKIISINTPVKKSVKISIKKKVEPIVEEIIEPTTIESTIEVPIIDPSIKKQIEIMDKDKSLEESIENYINPIVEIPKQKKVNKMPVKKEDGEDINIKNMYNYQLHDLNSELYKKYLNYIEKFFKKKISKKNEMYDKEYLDGKYILIDKKDKSSKITITPSEFINMHELYFTMNSNCNKLLYEISLLIESKSNITDQNRERFDELKNKYINLKEKLNDIHNINQDFYKETQQLLEKKNRRIK